MTMIRADWNAKTGVFKSQFSGLVTLTDVDEWKAALQAALDQIPDGAEIQFIDDLRGYEPSDLTVHQAMRTVIPLTLAAYGFETTFFEFFQVAERPIVHTRDITITAVAHLHHDEEKMTRYEQTLSRPDERFFTDDGEAIAWLAGLALV